MFGSYFFLLVQILPAQIEIMTHRLEVGYMLTKVAGGFASMVLGIVSKVHVPRPKLATPEHSQLHAI